MAEIPTRNTSLAVLVVIVLLPRQLCLAESGARSGKAGNGMATQPEASAAVCAPAPQAWRGRRPCGHESNPFASSLPSELGKLLRIQVDLPIGTSPFILTSLWPLASSLQYHEMNPTAVLVSDMCHTIYAHPSRKPCYDPVWKPAVCGGVGCARLPEGSKPRRVGRVASGLSGGDSTPSSPPRPSRSIAACTGLAASLGSPARARPRRFLVTPRRSGVRPGVQLPRGTDCASSGRGSLRRLPAPGRLGAGCLRGTLCVCVAVV